MNRSLIAILAVAALGARAEQPQDFARSAALGIDGKDALYEIVLPAAVYEGAARADLGDLRVFNGAGEVVPHAFRARVTETTEKQAPPAVNLALFPLHGDVAKGVEGSDFRFEKRGDRIVVQLRTREGEPVRERRLLGYVADASGIDRPIRALVFALPAGADNVVARLRVESSDDLAQWSFLGEAQVVHLESGGQRLERLRAEFPPRKAKYLRLSSAGHGRSLELAGVTAEPSESTVTVEAARRWTQAPGVALAPAKDSAGGYEFDLGGQFPADRIRLALPQQNTVVQVELLSRAKPGDPWRPVTNGVAYRLNRQGEEVTSPDSAIRANTDRYWLLRVDQRGGGLGTGQPLLNVGWVPHRLVFAARGDAPFRLTFGNREAKPAAYAIETLVPGYKSDAELKLASATVGEATVPPAAAAPRSAEPFAWLTDRPDWKRWMLWGSLVVAVLVLGLMAFRLGRQMSKPSAPPES